MGGKNLEQKFHKNENTSNKVVPFQRVEMSPKAKLRKRRMRSSSSGGTGMARSNTHFRRNRSSAQRVRTRLAEIEASAGSEAIFDYLRIFPSLLCASLYCVHVCVLAVRSYLPSRTLTIPTLKMGD